MDMIGGKVKIRGIIMIIIKDGKLYCKTHDRFCDESCVSCNHFQCCPSCKCKNDPRTSYPCMYCRVGTYHIH